MILEIFNILVCSCHYSNKLICILLFSLNAFGSISLCVHVRLRFVVYKKYSKYGKEVYMGDFSIS